MISLIGNLERAQQGHLSLLPDVRGSAGRTQRPMISWQREAKSSKTLFIHMSGTWTESKRLGLPTGAPTWSFSRVLASSQYGCLEGRGVRLLLMPSIEHKQVKPCLGSWEKTVRLHLLMELVKILGEYARLKLLFAARFEKHNLSYSLSVLFLYKPSLVE